MWLYGCATDSAPRGSGQSPNSTRGPTIVELDGPSVEVLGTTVDARPAALVAGHMVNWGSLRAVLSEAAGGEALAEVVLDMILADAVERRRVAITADMLAAERRLIIENLHPDMNESIRLLRELQETHGLGPVRFHLMLRRNASLRALVKDQVNITDESLRQMHELVHGEKRQARLITIETLAEAQRVVHQLEASALFADMAVEHSSDASAARGGLLEPISRADSAFPQVIRDAMWHLEPGAISNPILLDHGFAILKLERIIPANGTGHRGLEEVRPEMERLVRLNQERILMEQLARSLLANTSVQIFDESLLFSWDIWKRQGELP